MFAWTSRAGPATGSPIPLLTLVAGAFAPRVAGLWPAPHAAFLTAPAERRHLVCLALHRAGERTLRVPAEQFLTVRLKDAVRRAVAHAPDGLHAALAKLGEVAWSGEDYDQLLRLLKLPRAAKSLRHAERIDVERVRGLARLPDAALEAKVGGFGLTPAQAEVLNEAYVAVARARGAPAAEAAIRRWGAAGSAKTLFEAALDELHPEPPEPPFPGSPRLRPLATKAALRGAAGRYRNCLRTLVGQAASGRSAFYEWSGPPGAIVELARDDIFGWRLEEARVAHNDTVPLAAREALTAELRDWGVHVGRTAWDLERALRGAHRPDFTLWSEQQAIADLFGA